MLQGHLYEDKDNQETIFAALFTPPLADFDVLIGLRPEAVPGSERPLLHTPMHGLLSGSRGKREREQAVREEGGEIDATVKRARIILTHIPRGMLDCMHLRLDNMHRMPRHLT